MAVTRTTNTPAGAGTASDVVVAGTIVEKPVAAGHGPAITR